MSELQIYPTIAPEHYDDMRRLIPDLPPTHDEWNGESKGWKKQWQKQGTDFRGVQVTPDELRHRLSGTTGILHDLWRQARDNAVAEDDNRRKDHGDYEPFK